MMYAPWLTTFLPVCLLVIYLFVFYFSRKSENQIDGNKSRKLLIIIVSSASLIYGLYALATVFTSDLWNGGTRIVWTAVSTIDAPLEIGGDKDERIIGLPLNLTDPKIKISQTDKKNEANIEITGGTAFVILNNEEKSYLNGQLLEKNITVGDYQIVRTGNWIGDDFDLINKQGIKLAGFSLKEGRPKSLSSLLVGGLNDELEKLEDASIVEKDKLLTWASQILLVNDSGKIYLLDSTDNNQNNASSRPIQLPSQMLLRTSRNDIKFTVDHKALEGRNKLIVRFNPPWRELSALPPQTIPGCDKRNDANKLAIVIANDLQPCEAVFRLPFGDKSAGFRRQLLISKDDNKFALDSKENEGVEIQDCSVLKPAPRPIAPEKPCIGNSQATLNQGNYSFEISTIENNFSVVWTLLIFLSVWAFLVLSIIWSLIGRNEISSSLWVAYGILLVIWDLLVLRLTLSLRYVLDPEGFDQLSIGGLTRAFVALLLLPSLICIFIKIQNEFLDGPINKDKIKNSIKLLFFYVPALILFTISLNLFTPHLLWGEFSDYISVSLPSLRNILFSVGIVLLLLILFLKLRFIYDSPDETISQFFVLNWYRFRNALMPKGSFLIRWEQMFSSNMQTRVGLVLLFVIFNAIFCLLFHGFRLLISVDKLAQEVMTPVYFCLVTLFWLALCIFIRNSESYDESDESDNRKTKFPVVILVAFITMASAILVPLYTFDFGSITTVLSILLPLIIVLIAAQFKRIGFPILLSFILTFVLGSFFIYQNLFGFLPGESFISQYVPSFGRDRVVARLLNFKDGSYAQSWAIYTHRLTKGNGLAYQELLNGSEHIWETKAISHEGEWGGMGFGNSPNRFSQIRQDTIQYDSVFGFFIVSEYGLFGGICLLILYLFPLILVYIGGREHFDAGYAFAFILSGAFVLEAFYHAGMNLGTFPMSGRNLPLLSVNSPSDLFKWCFIFLFLMQALFWRYGRNGEINEFSFKILDDDTDETEDSSEQSKIKKYLQITKWKQLGILTSLLIGVLVFQIIYSGWIIKNDPSIENFSNSQIYKDVKWYIENGYIGIDNQTGRIFPDDDKLKTLDYDAKFLKEEIARFNALNSSGGNNDNATGNRNNLEDSLKDVKTLAEYNEKLRSLKTDSKTPTRGESIFYIQKQKGENNQVLYILMPNEKFINSHSFKSGNDAKMIPLIRGDNNVLVGPVWIKNRYQPAANPKTNLPLLKNLIYALQPEWKRLEKENPGSAQKYYGTLTLSEQLQKASVDFVTIEGLKLHKELLKGDEKLPPRLALSVITIPNGETLALAGYPRMSSSDNWEEEEFTDSTNSEKMKFLKPPQDWIDGVHLPEVTNRYGVEQNFETSLVMGSATKPIWAAAVLATHPNLDKQLYVKGQSADESSVFGLKIEDGDGWNLNSKRNGWINFKDYLKYSDNRYHVRLGFLGLAERSQQGSPIVIAEGGASSSQDEALVAQKSIVPWKKHPKFLNSVRVSQNKIVNIENNSSSALAKNFESLFEIKTGTKDFSFRRSFWTKNTLDDLNGSTEFSKSSLNVISPRIADFGFDESMSPRKYINVLYGGENNKWANIDLAGAFGTCITGDQIVPHITKNDININSSSRGKLSKEIVKSLQEGLSAVVMEDGGTAHSSMSKLPNYFKNLSLYAKTGTLTTANDVRDTSRIVFAIVKWDSTREKVLSGMIFSLVIEKGKVGKAAELLNDFLIANSDKINKAIEN